MPVQTAAVICLLLGVVLCTSHFQAQASSGLQSSSLSALGSAHTWPEVEYTLDAHYPHRAQLRAHRAQNVL